MGDCCDKYCDYLYCDYQLRDEGDGIEYFTRKKMKSGMTAEFFFDTIFYGEGEKRRAIVEPSFIVYKKRKDAWKIPDELTGRDGLEPLMFAKEKIVQLERILLRTYNSKRYPTIDIEVAWTNKKRGDLYKKILAREGYSLVYEDKCFYMRKRIRENGEDLTTAKKVDEKGTL